MKTTVPTKAAQTTPALVKKIKPKTVHKAAPKAALQTAANKSEDLKLKRSDKPKLVRDSFTIPKDEYLVLSELKTRMTLLMQPAKKSELLRAGLKVLAAMSDTAIKKALQAVPAIKTGRPADSKK